MGDACEHGADGCGRAWRSGARALCAVFPVLLVATAMLFVGGTGFWSDDYWLNQRSTVTGELPALMEDGWFTDGTLVINRGFFLRPLFYMVAPVLVTLTWNHDWIAQVVLVLAHGCAALVLWRLMLRMGVAQCAAGAGALVFAMYPMHYEAVYWASALPIVLSVLVVLGMMHLAAGLTRDGRGPSTKWLMLASLPLLAVVACSLNEQPASGVLALPLVYWAVGRQSSKAAKQLAESSKAAKHPATAGERRSKEEGRGGAGEGVGVGAGARPHRDHRADLGGTVRGTTVRTIWRALLPAVVAGVGVVVYLVLLKVGLPPLARAAPAGVRGGAGSMVSIAELPARMVELAISVRDHLWRSEFAEGAIVQGWRELRDAPVRAGMCLLVLMAAGAAWVWGRGSTREISGAGRALLSGAAAVVVGAGIFVSGFLPLLVIEGYIAAPRLLYWPCMGLAVALGGVLTMVQGHSAAGARGRAARRVGAALMLLVLGVWWVMHIGIAGSYRNRWEQDWSEGIQLRALVPQPAPGVCFVPLKVQSPCASTGRWRFDRHLQTVFAWPWTAPKFVNMVYGRDDLMSGSWRPWAQYAVWADERGILYEGDLGGEMPENRLIPWARAVPFVVTPEREVRLVTRIVLMENGERIGEVEVPLARGREGVEFVMVRERVLE